MNADVTQLAKMMRARRAAGEEPYTLLLGSSLSLTPDVRRAVGGSEDWEAFWTAINRTSVTERRALLRKPLSKLDLHAGCAALAQLVGAGYFKVVLTLNVDDALDNAFQTLPASEYRIWVHGEVNSRDIVAALDRTTPRIKVVKLRGDVNAYELPLTPDAQFEFPEDLETALRDGLRHDTIIVGDLTHDLDVQRCIERGEGALWAIAAADSKFMRKAKRRRAVGEVVQEADFNAFFTALAQELGLDDTDGAAVEFVSVPPDERVNPYRGLEPFEAQHAHLFFGRELLTEKLVGWLRGHNFLAVLGASGSGKSSVIRAGVLPALERGGIPGSAHWRALLMKPGQNPQEALADALATLVSEARCAGAVDCAQEEQTSREIAARLLRNEAALHEYVLAVVGRYDDDRRVVVAIDQFEELFTLCAFEQRQRFIDALLYAVTHEDSRVTVILTMRADFVTACTAYAELSELLASHQVWVRALDDAGLRAVIERPAGMHGMRYEPGLTPLILADVGREPGALPLLEDALWSLFAHCRRGDEIIELREYREIGGVQGALAKRADGVYKSLAPAEREYTRRILLRLVTLRGGQEATRRRARLDELLAEIALTAEDREQVQQVILRLTDARLLTTSQDVETGQGAVEVSHEILIRGWPRLREWIEEERDDLVMIHQLREAAAEWKQNRWHESYLYRGARLLKAQEWYGGYQGELGELAQMFMDASVRGAEAAARAEEGRRQRELQMARERAEEQAQAARRLRGLLAAMFVVFLIAVGAAAYAGVQQRAAKKQTRLSISRELAAAAIGNLDIDPERSILLAMQAVSMTYSIEAEDALHRAIQTSRVQLTLSNHVSKVHNIAFSPNGELLATSSEDTTVKIWDAVSGKELYTLKGHEELVKGLAFSSDGKRLATTSGDMTAKVWNIVSTQEPISITESLVLTGHTDEVKEIAFNPDGTRLATASADGTAMIWDASSGIKTRVITAAHDSRAVIYVAFSPDGTRLATTGADGKARIWDIVSGENLITLSGHNLPVESVAFSPDGTHLCTTSDDKTAKMWDAISGQELFTLEDHTNTVSDVAFRSDTTLATASADGTAKLWDIVSKRVLVTLSGHEDTIRGIAFSPDGTRLATASWDGTARVWNVGHSQEWLTLSFSPTTEIKSVTFSPDGKYLAAVGANGKVRIWDTVSGSSLLSICDSASPACDTSAADFGNLSFNRTGTHLVVACQDEMIKVYDLFSGTAPLILEHRGLRVHDVAFSPNGAQVAVACSGKMAIVYDIASGTELYTLNHCGDDVCDVTFNPDGTRLGTVDIASIVNIWDVKTGNKMLSLDNDENRVSRIVFSPEGSRLVTFGWDERAEVRDSDSGEILFSLHNPDNPIPYITFDPTGALLAVAGGWNRSVKLWDVHSEQELYTLRGHNNTVWRVAFSPDGTRLATSSWDGTVKIWDIASGQEMLTLYGHDAEVNDVAFSEDRQHIATAGSDGTVRVYTLDIEELMRLARSRVTRSLEPEECLKYLHRECLPNP